MLFNEGLKTKLGKVISIIDLPPYWQQMAQLD